MSDLGERDKLNPFNTGKGATSMENETASGFN